MNAFMIVSPAEMSLTVRLTRRQCISSAVGHISFVTPATQRCCREVQANNPHYVDAVKLLLAAGGRVELPPTRQP
jgi:hypothetical protein